MGKAKDIILRPIDARTANDLVKRIHYSGKVVRNSQLHIGVFYQGKLEGAMQFGPSLDKRKIQGLVAGTAWHEFIELNRMAFSDVLPRNSESGALAVAMKLLRKYAPQVKWVVTFADGTQCGDGTIYRAAGFVLTGMGENKHIWRLKDGQAITDTQLYHLTGFAVSGKRAGKTHFSDVVGRLEGHMLRYIYFIDPAYRQRLTVPELPYSAIDDAGARMYKGERLDTRPVNGDDLATSEIGRFDSEPGALDTVK